MGCIPRSKPSSFLRQAPCPLPAGPPLHGIGLATHCHTGDCVDLSSCIARRRRTTRTADTLQHGCGVLVTGSRRTRREHGRGDRRAGPRQLTQERHRPALALVSSTTSVLAAAWIEARILGKVPRASRPAGRSFRAQRSSVTGRGMTYITAPLAGPPVRCVRDGVAHEGESPTRVRELRLAHCSEQSR